MRMRSSVFSTCCPRPLGNLGSPDQSVSHQNCCTLSMDWALLILSRVRTPEVRLQPRVTKIGKRTSRIPQRMVNTVTLTVFHCRPVYLLRLVMQVYPITPM